jgi:voltage-gated potassium channel
MLRSLLVTVIVFALYFVLPFDNKSPFNTGLALLIGLVAVACLVAWQARSITRAPYPRLKAIEALVTSFPIVLLLFSTTYFVMGEHAAGTFTQPMTRIDALYFTVTTFSTVGFGDITAVSESARVVTIVQMLVDLVLLGLVVNVFLDSVRTGLARRGTRSGNGS